MADGGRLYVLACESGSPDWSCAGSLHVYRATGAGVPPLLAAWPLPFRLRPPIVGDCAKTHWMAASGGTMFVATGGPAPERTVRILDTRDPTHIREVGQVLLPGY